MLIEEEGGWKGEDEEGSRVERSKNAPHIVIAYILIDTTHPIPSRRPRLETDRDIRRIGVGRAGQRAPLWAIFR